MARNLLPYPAAPYIGGISSRSFNYIGRKGTLVTADILWPLYKVNGQALGLANPNFVVNLLMQAQGPGNLPSKWPIQSVYIDNEGVDFPVYVYFPDTFFTVSCPANSAGWYQAFTNQQSCLIAGIGITDAAIAASERTRCFFTDVQMVPSLDQETQSALDLWIGSTSIQRGTVDLPGVGPPALGDKNINTGRSVNSSAIALNELNGSSANTVLYLTDYQVTATLSGAFQGVVTLLESVSSFTHAITLLGFATPIFGPMGGFRGNLRFNGITNWTWQPVQIVGPTPSGFVNFSLNYSKVN